jgi:hypothetical protein
MQIAAGPEAPPVPAGPAARPVTRQRCLPQKLHCASSSCSGTACTGPSRVAAALPERTTLGKPDARVADVAVRARDQLADLALRLAAERAGQVDAGAARPVLAARTASRLDQLIKLLVAEPQRGSDLLRPRAAYDQMVHRTAELGPRRLGCLLGLGQPLLGPPGLGQQLLIHTATVARQLKHSGHRPRVTDQSRICPDSLECLPLSGEWIAGEEPLWVSSRMPSVVCFRAAVMPTVNQWEVSDDHR